MTAARRTSTPHVPAFAKPLGQVIEERRATQHFLPDPVDERDLDAMLALATQAPSGFNLQPWRFVVVRDPERRERLRHAAMDQEKVAEAPVVIVAFALREAWKEQALTIFRAAAERGARPPGDVEKSIQQALGFVGRLPITVWLNRHVMIAFTHLMLAAESLGWDTAPMEGFDAAAVREVVELPPDAEVIALLAIGRHREPDAKYPGRLPLEKLVYAETFGCAWTPAFPPAFVRQ